MHIYVYSHLYRNEIEINGECLLSEDKFVMRMHSMHPKINIRVLETDSSAFLFLGKAKICQLERAEVYYNCFLRYIYAVAVKVSP